MSNLSPSATKCLASSPCLGEGFEQSLPNASLWHPNPGPTDLNSVPLDSSYGSGVDMSCKAKKKKANFLENHWSLQHTFLVHHWSNNNSALGRLGWKRNRLRPKQGIDDSRSISPRSLCDSTPVGALATRMFVSCRCWLLYTFIAINQA